MTTSTRCRRCAVRQQGFMVVCPECSGEMEAWTTVEALPMREVMPVRVPRGCTCGRCERGPNSLTTRCQGVALELRAERDRREAAERLAAQP